MWFYCFWSRYPSGIGAEAVPIPLAQNKPVLSVATGEAAIANPQKISGNSEDSLFVWKDPTWNGGNPVTFVGIADGVGSWAKFGELVRPFFVVVGVF